MIRGSRAASSSREETLLDAQSAPSPRDMDMPFDEPLCNGVLVITKTYFLNEQNQQRTRNPRAEDGDHKEHSFRRIVVHQDVETVDFMMCAVFNSASYLRLWELSLAHSELATVFREKEMLTTLKTNWFVMHFVFADVIVSVLLIIDVLEHFMHAFFSCD